MSITTGAFMRMPMPVPSRNEQQKIAACLTSLDAVIAAQGREVEALKAHKRGLMQQLFPREGETRPRLRFPEFRDAPDWELKRLDAISPSIFDGTHQTPTYTNEGIPFFSVENLISGNANKYISREDYLLATKKNKPALGDVLITRIGKVGHSKVVDWEHEFSVYVTLAVVKRSPQVNSHFLHYAIQSESSQAEIQSKTLHNAVPPKINMDSLRATRVFMAQPAEQQRIAECLSSLDTQITAETDQLAALKTHKQGLMQQLFPAPEAA
jgi:type I restriction enzyme S subunit